MTFGWELVVLHTTPSMFSKFQCMLGGLNVWRCEQRTVHIRSLSVELIIFACTTSGRKLLKIYAKKSMENHSGRSPDEKSH